MVDEGTLVTKANGEIRKKEESRTAATVTWTVSRGATQKTAYSPTVRTASCLLQPSRWVQLQACFSNSRKSSE